MGEKIIVKEIQSLTPSAEIELYVIDLSKYNSDNLYFCSGKNSLNQPIVWQGKTYQPLPINTSGFDVSSQGTLPTPKIVLANIDGLFSSLSMELDNLIGCKLIRKRTFGRFLDAVNFSEGNPEANPNEHFPDQVWIFNRKTKGDRMSIEWELSSAFDQMGVQLPFGQITKNYCRWTYRSEDCGWTGGFFTKEDQATDDPSKDKCAKRLSSCKCRFGDSAVLPFGAFPGVQRV